MKSIARQFLVGVAGGIVGSELAGAAEEQLSSHTGNPIADIFTSSIGTTIAIISMITMLRRITTKPENASLSSAIGINISGDFTGTLRQAGEGVSNLFYKGMDYYYGLMRPSRARAETKEGRQDLGK